jgi:large subunit ribosomal protein L22
MEAIAKTKYLKGSPRKARLVIDLIRGQNVSRALSILKFTQKRAAQPITKCLNSAIANATYQAEQLNIAVDPDDLWVKSCFVDMGPTKNRRRMRPAPQGRAYREQRHYCHITIEVTSEEKPKTEKEIRAEAAKAKRAAAKKADSGVAKSKSIKKEAPKDDKKLKAEGVAEVETPIIEEAAKTAEVDSVDMVETPAVEPADAAAEMNAEEVSEVPLEAETEVAETADADVAESEPVDPGDAEETESK